MKKKANKKKTVNKKKTLQNILNKCNSTIGYSINTAKLNEKRNDESFLIEVAEFCGVPVEYLEV